MTATFVRPDGTPWRPPATETKPKRSASRDPKPMHAGWVPEGHPPGALEQARDDHRAMAKRSKTPMAPFDEDQWRRNTNPKRIGRPLVSPSAAEAAAGLARRSGWSDVRIVEVKRGEPEPNAWLDSPTP